MKKILSIVLALAMALCLCTTAFAASDIGVTIDGTAVQWTDAEPFIDANSRTLVPLRAIGEAMGLTVEWDANSREAVFTRVTSETDTTYGVIEELRFPIDSNIAYITIYFSEGDDVWIYDVDSIVMDTAAVIVNDRTYAPVRTLAESFGYSVDWDNDTRTVIIEKIEYYYLYGVIGWGPDSLMIGCEPGEAYEKLAGVEILSATVNGEAATVEAVNVDDEEFRSFCEEFNLNYFYAFRILADYEAYDIYDTVVVEWVIRETMADGTFNDTTYVNEYYVEGWWGWW